MEQFTGDFAPYPSLSVQVVYPNPSQYLQLDMRRVMLHPVAWQTRSYLPKAAVLEHRLRNLAHVHTRFQRRELGSHYNSVHEYLKIVGEHANIRGETKDGFYALGFTSCQETVHSNGMVMPGDITRCMVWSLGS